MIAQKQSADKNQLKLIIDHVPAGISYFDKEQSFLFANQQYRNFLGLDPSELVGKTLEEAIGKKPYKVAQKYVQRALKGEKVSFENTLPAKNGGSISILVSYVPDFGLDATVKGFFALVEDITDRKRNEASLAEMSALLKTTFETMNQGIKVYDADLKLVAFNQKFIDFSSYPPGFIRTGLPYADIVRFRAERGVYGTVDDIDALVRERVAARRQSEVARDEHIFPDDRVIAISRDPMPGGGYVQTFTDITERKRSEEALAEMSALLKTTFETMNQGINVYDTDRKLIAFNQNYIKFNNYPPELIHLGMAYEDAVRLRAKGGTYGPVDDIDALVRDRVAAFSEGEGEAARHERTMPDGRVIAISRDPMPGGGYVQTFTEITERKRTEEALQEAHDTLEARVNVRTRELNNINRNLQSEIADRKRGEEELTRKSELLMTTFDNMSQGIRVLDKELKVAAFNQKYIDLMAFPPGVVRVGIPLEELARFKAERGDHGPVDVEEFVNNRTLVRRRGKLEIYKYNALPNGLTVLCHHNPLPEGGFVATYTDITKREEISMALAETKERFRRLLESTNAIPWEADAKTWIFTYVGPQAVELLGYPRELWLEKDFWVEHIHPEDRAKTIDYCLKSLAQRTNYEFEYRMLAADGRTIWLHDIVNVVEPDGEPVALRGFMIDITERKSLEESQRNISSRLISAQEEERRKISRELHDDFGQRLALLAVGIQSLSQQMPEPESETVKSMDNLWSQTQKLSTDLHRLSHQLHPAILDQLGLGPAIRSLCSEISEQHGIQIKFTEHQVQDSIPRDISLCLYRTAQEGLRNIVKHSGAKDAKVELTGAPDTIHLRIADQGVGFDPITTNRKGLGLVSIEERIRVVKGEMSLQSRPSHGTCIDLRIPLAAPDT